MRSLLIWLVGIMVAIYAAYDSNRGVKTPIKDVQVLANDVPAPVITPYRPGTFAVRNDYTFSISIYGGFFPTIWGATNAPDGTAFVISVKRPWLPDARQRLSRGLAACGEDCLPATGPEGRWGTGFVVKDGRFSVGPFSFEGKPFWPAEYPFEITRGLTDDMPIDRIKDLAAPVLESSFQLRSDGVALVKQLTGQVFR